MPNISVNLMPWGILTIDPKCPVYVRATYAAIGWLVSLITTRPLNRTRRKLGLPAVGPEGFTSDLLDLVPVSAQVYPPDPRWPVHHRLVGYWFVKDPVGWRPAPDLLAFLGSGDPPLVVSLGAMSLGSQGALQSARLFVDAIQQAGVRAIVQGWEAGLSQLPLLPSIYASGSVPYSWLLPRAAGLIHHGGFGATSAGLRAGIPQLVIPHIADQFYWGQRVHQLGVGLPPIARPRLTMTKLAASLLKGEFGAARVAVFGSLVQSGLFHPRSDIDLAVWGLDERLYFRAVGVLHSLDVDFEIDLVIFDEARPVIQEAILSEGENL
ncbi:MAG: nucleotide disphospho-sugar-binding domain-containing protein [Chloroflexota bacterium]